MAALITNLRNRFSAELPLWRLSYWQIALLFLWSGWPWLAQVLFPGNSTLAFAPVFIFLPIAYFVGSLLAAAMPSLSYAYSIGISFAVFSVAYLAIVSWRQHRVRRSNP